MRIIFLVLIIFILSFPAWAAYVPLNLGAGLTAQGNMTNSTPVNASNPNVYLQTIPNVYTGNHTVTAAELSGLDECNASGNMTIGLPTPGVTGFPNGAFLMVNDPSNYNCTLAEASGASFTFTGAPVNGSGNIVLQQNGWALCTSNVQNASWDCAALTTIGSVPTNTKYRNITFVFTGNGSAMTAPLLTVPIDIPYTGTITGWTITSDQSCSATVDVWVAASGTYPTVSNSITNSSYPTLSGQNVVIGGSVASWTTTTVSLGQMAMAKLVTSSACETVIVSLQTTTN